MTGRWLIALGAPMLAAAAVAGGIAAAWPQAGGRGGAPGAATDTVTLAVGNMTCALCAVTVRRAVGRVDGVAEVVVDAARGTATVRFDPQRTAVAAIAAAARDAGFPAEPRS